MWERYDQTPTKFFHGIDSAPWPDLSLEKYEGVAASVASLEAGYEDIRAEGLALLNRNGNEGLAYGTMESLAKPTGSDKGGWHAKKLDCKDAKKRSETPLTCEVIDRTRREAGEIFTAQFLRLQPGTYLRPHCGEGNFRWVVHLGLEGLAGTKITVAGEQRPWLHKKCIVFDDSYRHSVVHEGSEDRVVLALQIPNPEYMKKVKLGELDSFITGDSRLD